MPSYSAYKTLLGRALDTETDYQMAYLIDGASGYEYANDASDDDIEWITVKGNHIPIKKGLSGQERGEAIQNWFKNKANRGESEYSETPAYAGSGALYDTPSLAAVGSGEGAAAHGYGLYYAENLTTAKRYAKKARTIQIHGESLNKSLGITERQPLLSYFKGAFQTKLYKAFQDNPAKAKIMLTDAVKGLAEMFGHQEWGAGLSKEFLGAATKLENIEPAAFTVNPGQVIKVRVPADKYLLSEKGKIKEQSPLVQGAIEKLAAKYPEIEISGTGEQLYKSAVKAMGSKKRASEALNNVGIKGISYKGKVDGPGFVIFNPNDLKVLERL